MRTSLPSRRSFLGVLAAGLGSSCAPFSAKSPFWGTIYAGIDPPKEGRLSREYVDMLPYASLAAWFDGSPRALLVLASFEPDGSLIWASADGKAISTRGPFVVKAIGTEKELRGTTFRPAVDDLRRADGLRVERSFDVWVEGERAQFSVEARFHAGKSAAIEILGRSQNVRRYSEAVKSGGKPRYRNDYWIDASDGFCWKSRQIVVPTMPHLNIEILKRPNPSSGPA